MKNKIIIPFILLFSVLIVGFVSLRSAGKKKDYPCKEPMEQCCKKQKSGSSSENPTLEVLSPHFVAITSQIN